MMKQVIKMLMLNTYKIIEIGESIHWHGDYKITHLIAYLLDQMPLPVSCRPRIVAASLTELKEIVVPLKC